jgi:hypothetical protein
MYITIYYNIVSLLTLSFSMNFIPYTWFIYLNYIICACLLLAPWVFNSNINSQQSISPTNIILTGIAVILFFILASSKGVPVPKTEYLDKRIVVLSLFIGAIILAFSHLILQFSSNTNLLLSIYFISTVQLVSITFSDLRFIEKAEEADKAIK